MSRSRWIAAVGCGMLGAFGAVAAEQTGQSPVGRTATAPAALTAPNAVVQVQEKEPAGKPPAKKEEKKDEAPQLDFAQLQPTSADAPSGGNPHMIGDLGISGFTFQTVRVIGLATFVVPPAPPGQIIRFEVPGFRNVRVPIAGRGGFKIGENETVLPGNRVFFSFNSYNNVQGPADGSGQPLRTPIIAPVGPNGTPVTGVLELPGVATPVFDIQRQSIGFEKTFLDGRFSFGMRVPAFQQTGDADDLQDIGDATFIFKYAPYCNPVTGTGVSVGVAITAPTGRDIPSEDGDFHPTLIQPFVGYALGGHRFFLNGFLSVAATTDEREVSLLFSDIGVGYWLYKGDGLISAIAPTVEAHITTALTRRSADEPITGIDLSVLTGGVHIGIGRRSRLTLGVAVPVSTPGYFDAEGVVQYNLKF